MNVCSPFDVYYHTGIKGIVERVKYFPKTLKWAYQRMMRGFSDYDVLELDSYLELLLPSMFESFKNKNDDTFPTILQVELCEELGIDYDDIMSLDVKLIEDLNNKCVERWMQILDRIIYCFKEANKDTCTNYEKEKYEDYSDYEFAMRQEAFELINKYFHSLWY